LRDLSQFHSSLSSRRNGASIAPDWRRDASTLRKHLAPASLYTMR
jgi:hypothetical protein